MQGFDYPYFAYPYLATVVGYPYWSDNDRITRSQYIKYNTERRKNYVYNRTAHKLWPRTQFARLSISCYCSRLSLLIGQLRITVIQSTYNETIIRKEKKLCLQQDLSQQDHSQAATPHSMCLIIHISWSEFNTWHTNYLLTTITILKGEKYMFTTVPFGTGPLVETGPLGWWD